MHSQFFWQNVQSLLCDQKECIVYFNDRKELIMFGYINVLALSIVVIWWVIVSIKETKKTNKRLRDEMDIRIEFFKNNNRLTDEIENLWTAVAYDKYGIYMNEEVGRKAAEFNEEERRKKGDK